MHTLTIVRRARKRTYALPALALGLSLLVSACGSEATPTNVPSLDFTPTAATATPTATAAPTATPTAADAAEPTPTTQEGRMAQDGDAVAVHYRGTLDSGEEFDSSEGREPLSFTVGSGQVIAGFDDAVRGMTVGESKSIHIPMEEAYGPRQENLVAEIPKENAPEGLGPGDRVLVGEQGIPAVVVEVTEEFVRVDANHPLAGEALNFELELVSIQ